MDRRTLLLGGAAAWLSAGREAESRRRRSTFVYVHDNGTTNRIHAFRFESQGTLTAVAGSPFVVNNSSSSCGGNCQSLAYSAKRKMLFATGGGGLRVLRLKGNGALQLVGRTPVGGGRFLGAAAIDRGSRTFVYASEYLAARIRGFEVSKTGSLRELPSSPFATGQLPDGLSSVGSLLFSANEQGGTVSSFRVEADGRLTAAAGSPVDPPAAFFFNAQPDPSGRLLYVGDCQNPVLYGYAVDAGGALTPLSPDRLTLGIVNTCGGVALGKQPLMFAYARVSGGGPDVQAVRRGTDGALEIASAPQTTGLGRLDVAALDPTERFLAVACSASSLLRSYVVDTSTGALQEVESEPLRADENRVNALLFVRP